MANNRMFLVHRPTGLAVGLGKRMGWGWYRGGGDLDTQVSRLFDVLENDYGYEGRQDDFVVALEDAAGAPLALDDWRYGDAREDGLAQLVFVGQEAVEED